LSPSTHRASHDMLRGTERKTAIYWRSRYLPFDNISSERPMRTSRAGTFSEEGL
jgi:hypothetical protein